MMRALYSGSSGIRTMMTGMDVIGNNISNVNTVGFKAGRATFQDTMSQMLANASSATGTRGGTNPQQIGMGVGVASIDTIMSNGTPQSTSKNTDLALAGSGFFVVKDGDSVYYTRNGDFMFGDDGTYGIANSGYKVQGWLADANGNIDTTAAPTSIVVPASQSMAAKATTKATYTKNLSADAGSTKIDKMTLNLSNGKSLIVPSTNTQDYSLADAVSGAITGMTAKLTDGTVVKAGSTTVVQNGAALDTSVKVDALAVTLADGTVVNLTSAKSSGVGAQLDGKITGTAAQVKSFTVTTNAGDLNMASASTGSGATAYKAGQTLTGRVTSISGSTATVTFDDNSTINVAAGSMAVNDSYSVTVNAISNVTLNGLDTVSKVGTGSFKLGNALSSTVSSMDVTLTGGGSPAASISTVGTGTFTIGSNLASNVDSTTVNVGSATFEIPSTDMTSKFTNGGKIQDGLNGGVSVPVGSEPTITAMSLSLDNGSKAAALSGKSYANGTTTYTPVTTTVSVFDSLGSSHTVPIVITKVGKNLWSVNLVPTESDGKTTKIDGATVTGTLGTLSFDDATGTFKSGTGYSLTMNNFSNGASTSTVALDFSALTQYAGESTAACSSDGYTAGSIKSVAFDASGIATAVYTNNEKRAVAQVAIATFNNPSGLEKSGSSLYVTSNNSGAAQISTVAAGGCSVTPSALESSNVDLASEFSNMIVTQRGYQANSKIITVSDEMLETLVNLKR